MLEPLRDSNYQHNEHNVGDSSVLLNNPTFKPFLSSAWKSILKQSWDSFILSWSINTDHFIELEMVAIIFPFTDRFLSCVWPLIGIYGQINSNNGQGRPFPSRYKWFLNCNKFMISPQNSKVVHIRHTLIKNIFWSLCEPRK